MLDRTKPSPAMRDPKLKTARAHKPRHCHLLDRLRKRHFYRWRWLLWLAVSAYLLLPALPPSLRGPGSEPLPGVRIYAYDLPPRFNRGWAAADARCARHLFAAEVAVHEALLLRQRRAGLRPEEADLFLVPVYVCCNFSTPTGLPSLAHARGLLADAVGLVRAQMPFWNRSAGADHVFVAAHDFGACFHPMEDVAMAAGIPEFLKRSILLQTFGVQGRHPCQDVEHVVLPPYVPPEVAPRELPEPEKARRDIFAFFRGKMEVHPKNISGHFYSRKVRTELLRLYGRNGKFHLKRKRYDGYRAEMARSMFCLCPLGWAPWSPRLVESVLLGCIPVIIADNIRLPFPGVLRWPDISLQVAERDVAGLEAVLDHVAATNLTTIQRNLWDPVKRKALVFNRPMEEGDATWQVLKELEAKLEPLRRQGRRRIHL
ncbi:probable glucuronosyltransferase Os03g0107900 isoform X1 [Triticum dicoccoides]|uniref:probable glucuronosyltransferase Os03g0107900 isoform X1 n=1 Tax=Triticum dicoccoides TaxID=85692 RepID=UPI00188DD6EB|nr:probable glucuronosyltransferase Os03g0107900 isoform X1 [Triticum dicoccoides]